MFQIIDSILGFIHLLVSCIFFFISLSVTFISAWVFFMLMKYQLSSLSIYIITSVLNCASNRLLISILFSSFFVVLLGSFIWAIFLCSFWQPPCVCFYILGRAALTPVLIAWLIVKKHTGKLDGEEPEVIARAWQPVRTTLMESLIRCHHSEALWEGGLRKGQWLLPQKEADPQQSL